MNKKLPLSIAIISFNEEKNLAQTLEAVKDIASEIIIVDSHSTDKTQEIASEYGANFFIEDWKGYTEQKNSALSKCTNPWILSLDCDELVTDALKEEITDVITSDVKASFMINRKSFYLGKLLNYTWQPDLQLRLVRRDASPKWIGGFVHEHLVVEGIVKKLKAYMIHYSYRNLKHHIEVAVKYSKLSAENIIIRNRKFSVFNLIFNPSLAFIKMYFFHTAFLDGIRGFLASTIVSFGTFMKYAFTIEKKFKQ